MKLTPAQQITRWSLTLAVFIGLVWLLGGVLTPYLAAMALAYFLDPVADKLEARGLSRVMAVVIITLVAMFIVAILAMLIVPTVASQLAALIESLPAKGEALQEFISTRFPSFDLNAAALIERFKDAAQTVGSYVFDTLINSTKTIFGIVALIVIVPVVTFYILLDWDNMIARIDGWLPRDHRNEVRHIAREIDKTLAGFIRGQGTVCLVMAIYYATVLTVIGLQYGMIIGIIAGLLAFIPFIGAFIGAALTVGFALFQTYTGIQALETLPAGEAAPWVGASWSWFGVVLALYFGGQSLEGNVITPRLVGKSVGLHPVWLMFSLSVFGSFMGLTGMLIAVPVAASIGVVGRYFLGRYQMGQLYLGEEYGRQFAEAESADDEGEVAGE